MAEPAYEKFTRLHATHSADGLRMGQRFCNMYIKASWPELYYCDDYNAFFLIYAWLHDHQYYEELPPVVNPNFLPDGNFKGMK